MDNTIISALITSIAGILGLVLGYFIREYRNRIRQLVFVYRTENKITKRGDRIEISEKIRDIFEGSNIFKNIQKIASLSTIGDSATRAEDIKEYWLDSKKNIEKFISLSTDGDNKEFLNRLESVVSDEFIEQRLRLFLVQNKGDDLRIDYPENPLVNLYGPNEDNQIYIEFPEITTYIDYGKDPGIRAKMSILVANIAALNKENLIELFKRFKDYMEPEYDKAILGVEDLMKIQNDNSRYAFFVKVTNIGSYPFLLHTNPTVKIANGRNKYNLELESAIIGVNQYNGRKGIAPQEIPLLLHSGETKELILNTVETESEMKDGKILRGIYESESGKYSISWQVTKPGLIKKQKLRSLKYPFKST